jgi:hypothetical protein
LHRRFCDIVFIVCDGAAKVVEFASDFVNQQVTHGETNRRVRAIHGIRVGAQRNAGKAKRENHRHDGDEVLCVMHALLLKRNYDRRLNTEAPRQQTSSTSSAMACKNTDAAMLFPCTTLACSSQ